jgi:hypothetical protein
MLLLVYIPPIVGARHSCKKLFKVFASILVITMDVDRCHKLESDSHKVGTGYVKLPISVSIMGQMYKLNVWNRTIGLRAAINSARED